MFTIASSLPQYDRWGYIEDEKNNYCFNLRLQLRESSRFDNIITLEEFIQHSVISELTYQKQIQILQNHRLIYLIILPNIILELNFLEIMVRGILQIQMILMLILKILSLKYMLQITI